VKGGWRKLHYKKLYSLYSSPNIIKMIKPRMRWAGHVVRVGEMNNEDKILVENPVGRDPSEDLGVDGSLWRRV
jgi:hypothetical protein